MVKFRQYLTILLALVPAALYAQISDLPGTQEELGRLKSEIKVLEDQLNTKTKKEKQTLESLELYTKQGMFLNKLINRFRNDEFIKQKEINKTRGKITSIEEEIKNIRDLYAKYVVYLYKYGKTDKLNYLINTESFNQALYRYKYLSRMTTRNKNNIEKLTASINELKDLHDKLNAELSERKLLEQQKRAEEKNLAVKINERKGIIKDLKNNKNVLRKQIELKRQSEAEIRELISKLIEDEKRKAAKLKKQNNPAVDEGSDIAEKVPLEKAENVIPDFTYASIQKGRMLWPVDNGTIIRKFGENKNEKLNTITLNYGVDIRTSRDKNVKAVAGGVVSSVTWLPGYGSILILTHKDNFRTVYGHLGEIYVSEGTQVSPGKIIGTISEGLEGNILHFEIWSERNNQNPELWLVRK